MPDEETTVIISVEELKTRLRLAGIDFSGYTDTDLEDLITLTIKQIENITDLPILEPRTITEFNKVSWLDIYVTDYFPISNPTVLLNEQEVEFKYLDNLKGILYFTTKQSGYLKVTYNLQYDNIPLLQGLITNMIILEISGDPVHGVWSSVKEGDVSVTYGAGSGGLTEKVDKTLNDLSGYFTPRIKIL